VVAVASLWEALQAREDAVRACADEVRARIEALNTELTAAEEQLVRLRITRETVDEVLAGTPGRAAPAQFVDLEAGAAVLAPLAGMLIAAAQAGDMTVTSPAYRRILVAVAEAGGPVRSKEVCAAVGLSDAANHTEAMRGKLKKLVGRGLLVESEPGRFALAAGGAR
jgi:hypothetical protein